jgi:hypothetical protein
VDFEPDQGAYLLRCGSHAVSIERIPLDLLFLLVERRGQLATATGLAMYREARLVVQSPRDEYRPTSEMPAAGSRSRASGRLAAA